MYKRRIGSIISSSIEELGALIKLSFRNNNKSNDNNDDVDEETLHSTSTFKTNNNKKLKRRRTISSSSSSSSSTRRKHVSFSSEVTSLEPNNNLSYRELKALWYDSATLKSFKKNAQRVILGSSSSDDNNKSNDEEKSVNKEEESTTSTITTTCCMRGLENCTIEREIQRKQIIRCVIRAYRNGRKPEQIAKISRRCGSWNRQNAIQQANNDYCEVYQPSLKLPKICNEPPTSPFVVVDSSMSKNRRRRTASSLSLSPSLRQTRHRASL